MNTPEAPDAANHPLHSQGWDNRRIFFVLAIGTLIVSAIWHAPQEAAYISERTGEIFFTLVLAMSLTYLMRPACAMLKECPCSAVGSRNGRTWATAVVFVATGFCCISSWPSAFVLLFAMPVPLKTISWR
jgi:hypothetical protein